MISISIAELILMIIIGIVTGILAGNSAVFVFNHLPWKWLCDYGVQTPPTGMIAGIKQDGSEPGDYTQRIKSYPWKLIFSMGFVVVGIYMFTIDWLYAIPAMMACWLLLLIAISDKKYMIIPDQLVLLLAITGMGFVPYIGSIGSMFFGALIGGGCMLLVAIAGKLIFRREVLGFGDVKLFAAVGLITGAYQVIFILIATSFVSCAAYGILILTHKIKRGDYQPLGVYIAAITATLIILGRNIQLQLFYALINI